jgi:hypothetical protein
VFSFTAVVVTYITKFIFQVLQSNGKDDVFLYNLDIYFHGLDSNKCTRMTRKSATVEWLKYIKYMIVDLEVRYRDR